MKKAGIVPACALFAAAAGAVEFDGTVPMLCVATSAVVCEKHRDCVQGPAEAVNLPLFWQVDAAAKAIASARAGAEPRTSTITFVGGNENHLVLQGEDAGLGWSVTIDKTTGAMVAAGGRTDGYIVFGDCTIP